MARISRRRRIGIIALISFGLIAVGAIFFPISMPHFELAAEVLWSPFGIPITNTMIGAWLTILVMGGIAYAATRKMRLVPHGLQNVMEASVEMLMNFVESIAGKENGRKFFPVVATIFIFVIANAWLALLPGFMSIGFWHTEGEEQVLIPLFRGANTDINVPLALALVSFIFVEYWGFRSHGFIRYMSKFVNVRQYFGGVGQMLRGRVRSGMGMLFSGIIDIFVGFIEMVSEMVRIMSFTFRLFGNMTAGEILIFSMMFLIPWVAAIPFYGLELFIGFVQALIFCGLTLVFLVMAVTPHEEH
ncbi:MAG: F0F1 ATP synthase subunit A [Dehalococcoidia bacterium]|nr:MAG: F0F1 ATP synthase subunit A [Dehalococcoidia bacterium]